MHRRLVYIYLLNVPSFSSRYFNKIKRTSHYREIARLIARNSYDYTTGIIFEGYSQASHEKAKVNDCMFEIML